MASIYEDARDGFALDMLKDFGQLMKLTKRTEGTYDPATSSAPVQPASADVYGAVMGFKKEKVDGATVRATDKRVILAASGLTIEPDAGDTLTIGGKVHQIINCEPFAPAGIATHYNAQVRSG